MPQPDLTKALCVAFAANRYWAHMPMSWLCNESLYGTGDRSGRFNSIPLYNIVMDLWPAVCWSGTVKLSSCSVAIHLFILDVIIHINPLIAHRQNSIPWTVNHAVRTNNKHTDRQMDGPIHYPPALLKLHFDKNLLQINLHINDTPIIVWYYYVCLTGLQIAVDS